MAPTHVDGVRLSRSAWVAVAIACLGLLSCLASPGLADTGGVSLVNDREGLSLFDAARPLAPGHPRTACVRVAADGASVRDTITLAATDVTGPLARALSVVVQVGHGGGGGSCAGFVGTTFYSGTLAQLAAVPGDGVATGWKPSADPTRTFRFAVSIPSVNAIQGRTAAGVFRWRLVTGPTPTPTPTTTTTTTSPAPTTTTPTPTPTTTTSSPAPTTPTATPTATTPTATTSPTATAPTATATTGPATPPGPTAGAGGGVDVDLTPGPTSLAGLARGLVRASADAVDTLVSSVLGWVLAPALAAAAGAAVAEVVRHPALPSILILFAVGFVAVQRLIDNRTKIGTAGRRRRRRPPLDLEFPDLFPAPEVAP